MTFKCCVPGCNNTGSKVLHSFPKEKVRCQRWIHRTKCFYLNSETAFKTHHKVCKNHFASDDYTSTMRKFLKSNAVPSLNLPEIDEAKKFFCLKNCPNQDSNECAALMNGDESDSRHEETVFENLEPSTKLTKLTNESQITPVSHNFGATAYRETVFENLEPSTKLTKLTNESQITPVSHNFGATAYREESVNDVLNDDAGNVEESSITHDSNTSNEHLETRTPYISDADEDDEFFPGMDPSDNIDKSTKNTFTLSDVLVPESNNASEVPIVTNPKTTNIHHPYNPAARRARYQATRIKFLTQRLRNSEKLKSSNILTYLEKKLDKNQMTFVRMQVKNAGKKPRGHRYTFEEKCMAFAIYKQSPKCYRYLSSILTLPCKQTLMTHSAHVRFEAGLNTTLMAFLSDVVKGMKDTDKIVTLGWDEMSLKAHLDYCKVKDYIDGFVDDGTNTTDEFATHALVFMVRGVNKSYKQPIAYFLTNNINKAELAELIKLITEAVMDVGLKIVGSVCDAVATNRSAVMSLMDPKLARLPKFCLNLLEYRIRNASIIHYFDPPHLIKSIRNNMLTKDLIHFVSTKTSAGKNDQFIWNQKVKKERVASWDDVAEFYKFTQKGINQLIPKITDEHISPKKKKMKVSVAVQIFSRTVGTTMHFCSEKKQLSRDFTGTADILIFFNEVFDSLNGGGPPSVKNSLKGSIHENSYHFTFWKYAVEMIKKMKFVPKDPEKQELSKVLNDYVLTINGLAELAKRLLKLEIESVSIKMMTQDALENFFGMIRSYCQAAVCPTPRNFRCSYATSMFNNLSSNHSIKSNCEEDGGIPLIKDLFSKFITAESTKKLDTEEDDDDFAFDVDNTTEMFSDRTQSTAENEAGNCFAGQICRIVLKNNQCVECEKSIVSRGKTEKYHGLMIARSQHSTSTNQLIMFPKAKFINSFKKLTFTLERSIPTHCSRKSLSKILMQAEDTSECFAGCDVHKSELTRRIAKLSSEMLITAFTSKVNNLLSGSVEILNDPRDHIQEAAFDFRQKKKHIGKYGDSEKC